MTARLNWLDRVVSAISPTAGFKRARARYLEGLLTGARGQYEGASRGRRTEGWRAPGTSANAETRNQLALLRNRSRDLVRNNAYAARAVSVIVNNVVGTGIIPQVRLPAGRRRNQVERLVRAWMDTSACDADGRHSFYGLQARAMRSVVESGEVLIRRRRRRASDGLAVPMQIQVIEPDFLDSGRDGPQPGGGVVHQGVEFDQLGRRVAYWLFDEHPGDLTRMRSLSSRRVPADQVIHMFRDDRRGQVRGVPWAAPVLIRHRDVADYEDAQGLRQKIAACFAAFVEGEDPADLNAADPAAPLSETLEPGVIEHLAPGKRVTFATPPGVEGYAEYMRQQLTAMAAGYGVTYEALTGDLSNVNFSSGRMGWIEFGRNVDDWRWHMLIPQMCDGVWAWLSEVLVVMIGGEPPPVAWTPPRRTMIDPAKEIASTKEAIRSGLTSLSEEIRQNGHDPDVLLAEIAADSRRLDELGLVLDSDPRKSSGAATPARPQSE